MEKTETDKALTVLRATVDRPKPANAYAASPTGTRLVNFWQSMGFQRFPRRLTTAEIVQISAVLVCLDVLAQDIAKVSFRMYEKLEGGGRREVSSDEHPIAELLADRPNRFHSWYEFFEMMMLHLGMVQNAFVAKRFRSGSSEIVEELIPCMPARTTILAVLPESDRSKRGFYAYDVQRMSPHEKIQLGGLPDVFLPHEFMHFRGRMFDGLAGYSNLEAGARTFGLAAEIEEYQERLFGNDGTMRGVFSHPDSLGGSGGKDDELANAAFERLRDQLAQALSDMRNYGRPIVLEEGMDFKQVSQTAEEAQSTSTRDQAIISVAQIFRMPPHKIMHIVNVKYENMETLEKSYVRDTLEPYCQRIEQKMGLDLLNREERRKYCFQFDRQEMFLNDIEKMSEAIKVQADRGSVTIDEIRAAYGRNPLPNGAGRVRFVPSTYNTVDDNNKVVIPAGAQPQGGDEKAGDDKKADADKKSADIIEYPHLIGETK